MYNQQPNTSKMAAMKLHRGVLRLSSATTAVGTRREPQCIIETSWLVREWSLTLTSIQNELAHVTGP